jgi:aminoglycoside phosphotransferase (APT) family kinase protein
MAGDADTIDHEAFEAKCRTGIEAWVAEHLGGTVVAMERLERWRPQWKVSYSAGGETNAVLVRGNRPIAPVEALRFEMECMQVLEANGILVPHIHGWCDDPVAFVMDWVETEDRAPGMLHTAIDDPSEMDADRWQAMLAYMEHLAAVHAVPVSEFAHISRLSDPPTEPREIALHAVDRMYAMGEMAGNIDPSLSFLQRWLRRNAPTDRHDVHFLCGDAGQFMSRGPEVAALLDFEIANVGDTHWDLACFRGRHPYENMGDIPALYREYERITGTPIDRRVVGYYTVAFLQLAVIGATFFMIPEIRGGNWIEGMLEKASITRRAYEAIAELHDIDLDHTLTLPEPTPDSFEASGLRKLIADIERLPTSTAFAEWERDLLGAIPEFLLNHARHRSWFERVSREDIEACLGERFADLAAADAAIQRRIDADDPADDDELVRLMHRRMLRLSMIVAGTDPDEANPFFYVLEPILDR